MSISQRKALLTNGEFLSSNANVRVCLRVAVCAIVYSLSMRMKASISETFALVLAKEATVAEHNVVDLIAGTLAVEAMPFLR